MRITYAMDPNVTYYHEVMKGIIQFAKAHSEVDLKIAAVAAAKDLSLLDRTGYDGLILGTYWENSRQGAQLATPAISVSNTHRTTRFARVVADDRAVGTAGARHLLVKGYRHLAFWGQMQIAFSQDRWEGFAATVEAVLGSKNRPTHHRPDRRTNRRWLAQMPRPLGLMAATDAMAAEAISAIQLFGLHVPKDVAVVGVDNDEMYCELTHPSMSSVSLHAAGIGFAAGEELVKLIRGETIQPRTTIAPGPVIERQSTGAIAADDPLVAQAVQLLQDHLSEGWNIAKVAGQLGLSRRMLELRCKRALGQTPGGLLAQIRLQHAQGLLATTDLPLKRIAGLCGYGRAARFSQVFVHLTGHPPSAYRGQFKLTA